MELELISCRNGHLNGPGQTFCGQCGIPLVPMCPNGHPIIPDQRFCAECGAAIGAAITTPTESIESTHPDMLHVGTADTVVAPDGVARASWFNAKSAKTQCALSAGLVFLLFLVNAGFLDLHGTLAELIAVFISQLCFLGLLALVARTPLRRTRALKIGALAAAAAVISDLLVFYGSDDLIAVIGPLLFLSFPIVHVTAWSVARRRVRGLKVGIAVALPAVVALQLYQTSETPGWMLLWPYPFIIGCLICWAVDFFANRTARGRNESAEV